MRQEGAATRCDGGEGAFRDTDQSGFCRGLDQTVNVSRAGLLLRDLTAECKRSSESKAFLEEGQSERKQRKLA
eukprot:381980-Hanusia_phi.AAC.1